MRTSFVVVSLAALVAIVPVQGAPLSLPSVKGLLHDAKGSAANGIGSVVGSSAADFVFNAVKQHTAQSQRDLEDEEYENHARDLASIVKRVKSAFPHHSKPLGLVTTPAETLPSGVQEGGLQARDIASIVADAKNAVHDLVHPTIGVSRIIAVPPGSVFSDLASTADSPTRRELGDTDFITNERGHEERMVERANLAPVIKVLGSDTAKQLAKGAAVGVGTSLLGHIFGGAAPAAAAPAPAPSGFNIPSKRELGGSYVL